jgi:hypothetical protein
VVDAIVLIALVAGAGSAVLLLGAGDADGVFGKVIAFAGGRIATRRGDQAVSAGTIRRVPNVTSQTRCRAPAEALRIVTVTASAVTRMSVAFSSIISVEIFDAGSVKRSAKKD